jgi:uncharacterized membrane protein
MTNTTARWAFVILGVTAIDLAVRFLLPFDLRRVMRVEGVLFMVTGFLLLQMARRAPPVGGWRRVLRAGLVASFLLAGLRAALWGLGTSPIVANVAALVGAVAIGTTYFLRRRSGGTRRPTARQTQ